jgi:putative membrane protein
MGWGWLGLGFVHMVLFWLLVIVCIGVLFVVVRRTGRHGAMEILQMRYAKGEIDRDQFERMKRELAGEERKERSPDPLGREKGS